MALPASLTDIANLALSYIGEATINNINTSNDQTSLTMRRWIDSCIKEVQVMVNWDELYTGDPNDISAAITLTSITDSYAGVQGQYQFVLPANFLQVLETNSFPPGTLPSQVDSRFGAEPNWKLQNGYLIARVENFEMFYQRLELDPSKWSTQMTEMIYLYLASKVCFQITDDNQLAQQVAAQYNNKRLELLASRQNRARKSRKRPRGFSYVRQKRTSNPQQFP